MCIMLHSLGHDATLHMLCKPSLVSYRSGDWFYHMVEIFSLVLVTTAMYFIKVKLERRLTVVCLA